MCPLTSVPFENRAIKRIPVSVLMSTYEKENPSYLDDALKSIFSQTALPLECVLVLDGPIPDSITDVIDRYARSKLMPLLCVQLAENRGLAGALNAGIEACRGEWIARMDSDDISIAHRLESQWAVICENPDIDVVCSWHAEFDKDPESLLCVKKTPQKHELIIKGLKLRNVVSHPTIMIRKNILKDVGGYRSNFGFLEDWDLYVRLAIKGARFFAIQEPLLKVRATYAQRVRRSGFHYVYKQFMFRWSCYSYGFVSVWELFYNGLAHSVFTLLPPVAKSFLYRFVRSPYSVKRGKEL